MSFRVELFENPAICEVHHPGWSFYDIHLEEDARSHLKIWHLLSSMDMIREQAFRAGYLKLMKVEETSYVYSKCVDLLRKIDCRELFALGVQPYAFSLLVKLELVFVGKSSLQINNTLLHAVTKTPLFTSSFVIVCVDKITRQVSPLPEWWSSHYKPWVSSIGKALRVSFKGAIPQDGTAVSRLLTLVTPGDVDYYDHTNNQIYPQFAFHGILAALKGGYLCGSLQRADVESTIKCIEAEYIADSVNGDKLLTETWQSADNQNVLWSRVMKGNTPIYVQKTEIEPNFVKPHPSL